MTETEAHPEEAIDAPQQDGESNDEDSANEEQDARVLLRGPDLLTPTEASQIAADGLTRVVIWAGERHSGKTTLSAELYERHRTGQAKTVFAGSETLLGFEERIHPARLDSGRVTPRTLRTESDPEERELLHLAVSDDGEVKHILFADLPGEHFRRIRDHERDVGDVPLMSHADKLAIVVDGGLIADNGLRSAAINFARQLVRQLKSSELPVERMDVILLLTKLDLVLGAGSGAVAYWDQREAMLLEAIREFSPEAQAYRTAARGLAGQDDGMDELMAWILREPPEPPETETDVEVSPVGRFQRIRAPRTEP